MTQHISLSDLQNDYDAMVLLAAECGYDLTPTFQQELIRLGLLVKALGGRV